MPSGIPDTYICPNCGKEVSVGTQSCPGCSNRDQYQTIENEIYDGIDLPESLDESIEFRAKVQRNKIMISVISAVLLLIFIFGYVF
jgi:uncharacterized membrane protein YvbJ